jgi:hypothetical protein
MSTNIKLIFMIQPVFENSKQTAGKQSGFIVLMSVILLCAIGVAIATSLVLLGLNNSLSNFGFNQSQRADFLASACVEQALDLLRLDAGYAGNETVAIGSDSCQILPVVQNDSVYTIQAQSSIEGTLRRVEIFAQRAEGPPAFMQINAWQAKGDF